MYTENVISMTTTVPIWNVKGLFAARKEIRVNFLDLYAFMVQSRGNKSAGCLVGWFGKNVKIEDRVENDVFRKKAMSR